VSFLKLDFMPARREEDSLLRTTAGLDPWSKTNDLSLVLVRPRETSSSLKGSRSSDETVNNRSGGVFWLLTGDVTDRPCIIGRGYRLGEKLKALGDMTGGPRSFIGGGG